MNWSFWHTLLTLPLLFPQTPGMGGGFQVCARSWSCWTYGLKKMTSRCQRRRRKFTKIRMDFQLTNFFGEFYMIFSLSVEKEMNWSFWHNADDIAVAVSSDPRNGRTYCWTYGLKKMTSTKNTAVRTQISVCVVSQFKWSTTQSFWASHLILNYAGVYKSRKINRRDITP
jgi:hypothetical protein